MSDWLGDLMRSRYRARAEADDAADAADETSEFVKGVDLDAAARSERPAQPINMNDVVRSVVLGGSVSDWRRERERSE